ncbi:MBL fold metallo-hydrolase [Haloferula sp. BvORR071]|uniref:MBL fold metallo-hydrolase n=1 Tax=Haloferula sp. BvORR071 TaxID=1396141 RepID=UPI0005519985|nr:MBL fold metallo-hydrolase [Haloferula sp. BvORR071]
MPDCFTGGFVQTNGYLIETPDGGHVLIDAPMGISQWLAERNVRPQALLLTHQHYDHVEDAAAVAGMGVRIYAWSPYSQDLTLESMVRNWGMPIQVTEYAVDELLEGRDSLEIGGLRLELAHVPGHSPDSVTFYRPESGELFGGDTLFEGSIGRADLPGGNMAQLVDGIRAKLFVLPESTRVFPGHGPVTTIGAERAENPYVGD